MKRKKKKETKPEWTWNKTKIQKTGTMNEMKLIEKIDEKHKKVPKTKKEREKKKSPCWKKKEIKNKIKLKHKWKAQRKKNKD